MSENITAVATQHDSDSEPIVHLSDGSSIALNALVAQALKWQHAKSPGAVDRAMNRAEHADQLRVSAEKRAAEAESAMRAAQAGERQSIRDAVRLPKVIEQAGAWKRRALAAESDLELAREQARYRESELVRSGHQQLLEAQANALDTIQRIAAQLPVDPIIDAKVVVPDVEVDTWFGEDDTPVVQIDTHRGHGRLRINLNDGVVWDGNPETDERPGAYAEALPSDRSLTIHVGGQQSMKATISRQLDTIRDQAEHIEELQRQLRNAKAEAIAHCNEQLHAITAAAKLREGHAHQLARLLNATFARRHLPFGPILTRALHTVLADHGVDVSAMPGAGPVTAQAIAPDRQLVTEHARLARAAAKLAAFTLGQPVSGSPKPTDIARYVLRLVGKDIADCA